MELMGDNIHTDIWENSFLSFYTTTTTRRTAICMNPTICELYIGCGGQLQDCSKNPSGEVEVKFHLSSLTLEPKLRSMAYIGEQLSTPTNRVAVINLKVLWLKSHNSEVWLDHRTNYTRSLAVMSMIHKRAGSSSQKMRTSFRYFSYSDGNKLELLMVEICKSPVSVILFGSGKILHIDFVDYFEALMNRE